VFKLLSRGVPIPESIQNVIPHRATPELERLLSSSDPTARIVDSVIQVQKSAESAGLDSAPGTGPAESASTAGGASSTKTASKVEGTEADASELPKGPFLEDQTDSGIYPYNAYVHPFSHFKSLKDPKLLHTRLQRLIAPSVTPGGLDPHQIIAERNRDPAEDSRTRSDASYRVRKHPRQR
jgi:ATP-dependent helicase STH1/SNF2